MATRLYYQANTQLYVPLLPTPDAGWGEIDNNVFCMLDTVKVAATQTVAGGFSNAANANDLCVTAVTKRLDVDQSILSSGTWSGLLRGRELLAEDNITQKIRKIWVMAPDGSTRGTLHARSVAGNATEILTSLCCCQMANAGGFGATVNALAKDRIIIEFGLGSGAGGTTPLWEVVLGGTGTDHAIAQGDQTGTVAWIEFSQNLTFMPEDVVTPPFVSQYSSYH